MISHYYYYYYYYYYYLYNCCHIWQLWSIKFWFFERGREVREREREREAKEGILYPTAKPDLWIRIRHCYYILTL